MERFRLIARFLGAYGVRIFRGLCKCVNVSCANVSMQSVRNLGTPINWRISCCKKLFALGFQKGEQNFQVHVSCSHLFV